MPMTRQMNEQLWNEWVVRVGGVKEASRMILEKLECSTSKADKLARGVYPSMLTASEQKDLAQIVRTKRDILFVPVGAGAERAS